MKLLERSGLRRTQQGAAIVLTGRDMEEEVLIDDLARIHPDELVKLKKVPLDCFCGLLCQMSQLLCTANIRCVVPCNIPG